METGLFPGGFVFMDDVAAGGAIEGALGFKIGVRGCFFIFGDDGVLHGAQRVVYFFAPAVINEAAALADAQGFFG